MKIIKIIYWLIFAYLLLVTFLSFNSNLVYGNGIGDIVSLFELIIIVIIQFSLVFIPGFKKQNPPSNKKIMIFGILFLTFALYITYSFSIGRGGEYPWKGNLFYHELF